MANNLQGATAQGIRDDVGADSKKAVQAPAAEPSRSERNFPTKLWDLLASLEAQGLDHIVSWAPHGRCFVVRNQEEFVRSILPVWFRQTKFTSFQRQLNIYGFTRLTAGKDKHGYFHPLFVRNDRSLAKKIERHKLKGTGTRKPGEPDKEPNFYNMPFLPASPRGASSLPESARAEPGAWDRSAAAREDSILAQLLAAHHRGQQSRPTPQADPSLALLGGMPAMQQQRTLSPEEALRLASARRTVAQLTGGLGAPMPQELPQQQQQQQQQQPSQLDILLASARLKAALASGLPSSYNTGLILPSMDGLSSNTSLGMLSNPRTSLIQSILGLSDNPQQSSDALRRALLQSHAPHPNADFRDL